MDFKRINDNYFQFIEGDKILTFRRDGNSIFWEIFNATETDLTYEEIGIPTSYPFLHSLLAEVYDSIVNCRIAFNEESGYVLDDDFTNTELMQSEEYADLIRDNEDKRIMQFRSEEVGYQSGISVGITSERDGTSFAYIYTEGEEFLLKFSKSMSEDDNSHERVISVEIHCDKSFYNHPFELVFIRMFERLKTYYPARDDVPEQMVMSGFVNTLSPLNK